MGLESQEPCLASLYSNAVNDLDKCIRAQEPPVDEFRFLAMAYASFRNDQERTNRIKRLGSLASLPAFEADYYQITVDEIIEKDLNNLAGEMMETSYLVPQQLGQITEVSEPGEIAKLKGIPYSERPLRPSVISAIRLKG
jgi:hypothetical protein